MSTQPDSQLSRAYAQQVEHAEWLQSELERVKAAIIKHRDQHGDDRCWLDDQELYAALGDGIEADNTMPPREKFLSNCARFYDNRCRAGDWPSYQELEAKLESVIHALDKAGIDVPHAVDMKILSPAERVERLVGIVTAHQSQLSLVAEAVKVSCIEYLCEQRQGRCALLIQLGIDTAPTIERVLEGRK